MRAKGKASNGRDRIDGAKKCMNAISEVSVVDSRMIVNVLFLLLGLCQGDHHQ
jgi:hypothetical protein